MAIEWKIIKVYLNFLKNTIKRAAARAKKAPWAIPMAWGCWRKTFSTIIDMVELPALAANSNKPILNVSKFCLSSSVDKISGTEAKQPNS